MPTQASRNSQMLNIGVGAASLAPVLATATPLVIGTAGIGALVIGGLMVAGAMATNKNIRKQLIAQYMSIDTNIKETRLGFYDATLRASKENADQISQTKLALSGFGSGLSNNEYIAQVEADKQYDQILRNRQQNRVEEQFAIQKENAYSGAVDQSVDVLLAGIGGAIQGAQLGAAVGGGIESFRNASANRDALKAFQADWAKNGASTENLARAAGYRAGVEPRLLTDTSSVYFKTFESGIATDTLQKQILINQVNQSSILRDLSLSALQAGSSQYGSPQFNNLQMQAQTQRNQSILDYWGSKAGSK